MKVLVSPQIYFRLVTHALCTEREENMGLLLGDTTQDTIEITHLSVLNRSDKTKDRVEIAPEQLTSAIKLAEKLTFETRKNTRVIGWYHSHPNITIFPSHVDVRTQVNYQAMDSQFIGLIVSCFNKENEDRASYIQLIAFQGDSSLNPRYVPITFVNPKLEVQKVFENWCSLPSLLYTDFVSSFHEFSFPDPTFKRSRNLLDSRSSTETKELSWKSGKEAIEWLVKASAWGSRIGVFLDKIVGPMLAQMIARHETNLNLIDEMEKEIKKLEDILAPKLIDF